MTPWKLSYRVSKTIEQDRLKAWHTNTSQNPYNMPSVSKPHIKDPKPSCFRVQAVAAARRGLSLAFRLKTDRKKHDPASPQGLGFRVYPIPFNLI